MKKFTTRSLIAVLCLCLGAMPVQAASVDKYYTTPTGTTTATVPVATTVAEETNILNTAENTLRNMSRAERRQKMREVRKAFREWRHRDGDRENTTSLVLLIILAILIPPLAVGLYERRLSSKFWISLLLTILFFLPGMIYSLLVVTGVA